MNFEFSDVAQGDLRYNSETKMYEKFYGDVAQIDVFDSLPLSFDNVFVLFCDVALHTDGYVTNFTLTQGEGVYVNGGSYIDVMWEKGDPDDQLKIKNLEGEEVVVAQGKSYIAMVANTRKDTLEIL